MTHELYTPKIEVQDVTKRYSKFGKAAVDSADLTIASGSFAVLMGRSGSGKTTLLNSMSGIDMPNSGKVIVNGTDITKLSKREREQYRAGTGRMFQSHGLINGMTARENIEVVHDILGHNLDKEWMEYLTSSLEVGAVLDQPAGQLSGGQAQRIGIIRALAHRPEIAYGDEPTGALDSESAHNVYGLFSTLAKNGMTVVVASHDEALSRQYANDIIRMQDGKIVSKEIVNRGRSLA